MEETNNPLPSNNQPSLEKPPGAPIQGAVPKKSFSYIWIILGVIILVGVAAGAYYFGQMQPKPKVQNNIPADNNQQKSNSGESTTTPIREINLEDLQKIKGSTIEVEWLPELVQIPYKGTEEYQDVEYYEAGKIKDGIFAGQSLVLRVEGGLGMSYAHELKALMGATTTPQTLENLNVRIKGITDIPEEIPFPGTMYKLKKNYINSFFKDLKITKKLFTDPILGDFYLTEQGCFAVELPDHTAVTYDYIIPFVNKDTRVLQVTYNSNSYNSDPYTYTRITGCGALCMYLAQMDEANLKPIERLTEAGTSSNGETLYSYKDPNDPALVSLYNDKNTMPYIGDTSTGYQPQAKSKYTYSEFLSHHPLLYWKDPLGRWVEMKNDRFQIAAEMCKPVIYLYPKKTIEVAVEVLPNGGFTYTKPQYQNGWKVLAYPDGTVKNLSDGQNYPYLFWEGIGLNYPEQESGFVVGKAELDSFFTEQLIKLGLQGREIMDFKDYWVPRLEGLNKPYYKITFLKKEQMDKLAPLKMSINPNSVIRVMMTARGLDSFEFVPKQEIPLTPQRIGFTVVEWGGTVLK